jgi:hypothetical protein
MSILMTFQRTRHLFGRPTYEWSCDYYDIEGIALSHLRSFREDIGRRYIGFHEGKEQNRRSCTVSHGHELSHS